MSFKPVKTRRLETIFLAQILMLTLPILSQANELEVLHWWTSEGENQAANYLRETLSTKDVEWIDAAIEGGGGEGAMAVLKGRVLRGRAPAAAQIIGPDIKQWAALEFLGHFNIVALNQSWPEILHPTVDKLLQFQNQYVAVPFGVHRVNWVWANKSLLEDMNTDMPTTWDQFFTYAKKLQQAGIVPLAHGNEPWQNATLFEAVILSLGGPTFYVQVFVELNESAIRSETFAQSLQLFARLKTVMDKDINGRTWSTATEMIVNGEAGMQIMGDWVQGDLIAHNTLDKVICQPVPHTEGQHLYSIDTMVMFADPENSSYESQITFAETMLMPDVQLNYNFLKGSVPVRNDIALDQLDRCSQSSYQAFIENEATDTLAPSLAHSMAASAEIEDVFVKVIHDFFQSSDHPIHAVQEELVRNIKSIRE